MTTYRIEDLTVIATDDCGEDHDLNARGEPCATERDLCEFVFELCTQGAFDVTVRAALLRDLALDLEPEQSERYAEEDHWYNRGGREAAGFDD